MLPISWLTNCWCFLSSLYSYSLPLLKIFQSFRPLCQLCTTFYKNFPSMPSCTQL